ncbi:MAG: thiamine-phosphate synthase family protein [candidate division WOR-3 bacterium]
MSETEAVIQRLTQAVQLIESCAEFVPLIPEVRTNIVFALPDASTPADVAAVDGRITVINSRPKAAGPVRFGASDHLARFVLELRRFDPGVRSAVNFRWNERIRKLVEKWAGEHGFRIGVIDRTREPEELLGRDRMSAPWKVEQVLQSTGGIVPEIVSETAGWGKEPMFILLGPEPVVVARRLVDIARIYHQSV